MELMILSTLDLCVVRDPAGPRSLWEELVILIESGKPTRDAGDPGAGSLSFCRPGEGRGQAALLNLYRHREGKKLWPGVEDGSHSQWSLEERESLGDWFPCISAESPQVPHLGSKADQNPCGE